MDGFLILFGFVAWTVVVYRKGKAREKKAKKKW